ncbi:hypothetical protein PHMEG_00039328, partial [Phytophthora megakarya]
SEIAEDSDDENWSGGEDSVEDDEEKELLTGESAGSKLDEEADISVNLVDSFLHSHVISIITEDMTKAEKLTCIYTMLGVLMQTDTTERRRGSVSPLTLQRYKKHVRDGSIFVIAHGNMLNKSAAKVNLVWLVKWFKNFAAEVSTQ